MKKIAVKKSSAGLGLFATEAFKKGELVIEYTGEKITEEEANRRGGKYASSSFFGSTSRNWSMFGCVELRA